MNIEDLREQIDLLDDKIVELFLKRLELCKKIGVKKSELGVSVTSESREAAVLKRLTDRLSVENKRYVEKLYAQIFSLSKDLQASDLTSSVYTKNAPEKLKACLVGGNVTKSFSKTVHGYFGTEYDLVSIKDNADLATFICGNDYSFYNVTMPYKKAVIPYLDELSDAAKATGVVNTVAAKNGKKWGYNTDIDGLSYIFKSHDVSLKDENILILGTGATSKTAEYVAKNSGAKNITFVGRNQKINYDNCYDLSDTNIIINTTPVGMNCNDSPIDLKRYPKLKFVLDVVYTPLKTRLIFDAENLGIKCAGGLEMLVRQAQTSEIIWRNALNADEDFLKNIDNVDNVLSDDYLTDFCYRRFLKEKKNIVLIGMPSCGKSSVAKLLAEKLNRDFCDTDVLVERLAGKTIEEIIDKDGEASFRAMEKNVANDIGYETGKVIATGGGVGANVDEMQILKGNAFVVYLDRDLAFLKSDGRPLSQKLGVKALYSQRKDLYEKFCDVKIDNNGDIKTTVERIIRAYEKDIDNKRS